MDFKRAILRAPALIKLGHRISGRTHPGPKVRLTKVYGTSMGQ